MMNDEEVRREITRAKYKGFGVGLLSAWAIAIGGLEVAVRLDDMQILSNWEDMPHPAIQREYQDKSQLNSKVYDFTNGKSLSQYIINIEREGAELK